MISRVRWYGAFVALLIVSLWSVSNSYGTEKYGKDGERGSGTACYTQSFDFQDGIGIKVDIAPDGVLSIKWLFDPAPQFAYLAPSYPLPLNTLDADRCYAESYRVKVFERAYEWNLDKRRRAYDSNQLRYASDNRA